MAVVFRGAFCRYSEGVSRPFLHVVLLAGLSLGFGAQAWGQDVLLPPPEAPTADPNGVELPASLMGESGGALPPPPLPEGEYLPPPAAGPATDVVRKNLALATDVDFDPVVWPGAFVGARAAFGVGGLNFPGFGTPSFSQLGAGFQAAPYFGLEAGYVPLGFFKTSAQWGFSFTSELTPFGPSSSGALTPPIHWTVSALLNFIPHSVGFLGKLNGKIRWVVGLDPFVLYSLNFGSTGIVSRGWGVRAGAHYRINSVEKSTSWTFDGFALLSLDRFTDGWLSGNANPTPMASLIGQAQDSWILTFLAGLQVNLKY